MAKDEMSETKGEILQIKIPNVTIRDSFIISKKTSLS